jgi:hypothetical protein
MNIGMPEVIVVFAIVLVLAIPIFVFRMAYNRGYAKGLERARESKDVRKA